MHSNQTKSYKTKKTMNIEQIKEIASNYKNLIELVEEKIVVIECADSKGYYAGRHIDSIKFVDNFVEVTSYDNFANERDSHYFTFPIEWLTKTDSELKEIVVQQKEEREKEEQEIEKQNQEYYAKKTEQKEFEQYQLLKAKFEKE